MKQISLAFSIFASAAASCFAGASAYQDLVLQAQPVGYWRLGEVSSAIPLATNAGVTAPNNNGTFSGVVPGQPGALAGDTDAAVATVAAQSAAVLVPYSAELNINGPFTVEVWAKPTNAVASGSFVSPFASLRRSSPAAEGWILYQAYNGWNFRVGDSVNNYTGDITGGSVVLNAWQHLAGVYDGGGITLYVNGQQVATVSVSSFAPNPSVALGIGARGDSSFFFDGAVDEAAIYAEALSAERILAHYNNGMNAARAIPYAEEILSDTPIAYYRLNEPAAGSAVNLGSLAAAGNGVFLGQPALGQTGALLEDPDTAAGFSGASQKVDVPYAASLNNSNAFSFECWAKVLGGAGNYRSPLTSRDDIPQRGYIIYAGAENTWQFWSGTGAGWHNIAGPAVVEGEWTHLVGTYDGQYKSFYVNGVLLDSVAATISPNTQRPLRIGGGSTESTGNFFFNGDIDEVAVYDTVLTSHQIYERFLTGSGAAPAEVGIEILAQPEGTTQFEGATVTLAVRVRGATPFNFQWYRLGGAITDATNATLVLANAQVDDTDDYWVEIDNGAGLATSTTVSVLIESTQPPTITAEPQSASVYQGGRPTFSVTATGSISLTYQWNHNNVAIPGATNATLTIAEAKTTDAGEYQVVVTSAAGSTPSAIATLEILVPEVNTYSAFVMADRPVAYWRLNELAGEVANDYSGGHQGAYLGVILDQPGVIADDFDTAALFDGASGKVEVPYSPDINPAVFTVECWAKVLGGAGGYRSPLTSRDDTPSGNGHGFIFYAAADNSWQLWTGTGNTASPWAMVTGPAIVEGEWAHLVAVYDGTNQSFYVNGVLAGRTATTVMVNTARMLRIGAGQTENPTGTFFFNGLIDEVAIYDTPLTANRVALHYAGSYGVTTPPAITQQPVSQSVLPGGTVTLSANAVGSLPLSVHWELNGVMIPNATNLTLVLTNVQLSDSGDYQLVASNIVSIAGSDVATITVINVANMPYNEAVYEDNPVGYWRLGDSGDTAMDEMVLHDGTYMNGVTLGLAGAIPGDENTAAGFTAGGQNKIEMPYSPDLNPDQFTIECWAKVTGAAGNYRSPITSRDDYPQRGYLIYAAANNQWEFWSGTGQQVGWSMISGPSVVLNEWAHLVGTYDGTEKRFYVNGELIGSQTVFIAPNTARVLRIGGGATDLDTGNFFFEGAIDEVAIYPMALSQERILVHYAIGAKQSPQLAITRAGGVVTITWSHGKLQSADAVGGPYTDVSNASSPYTLTNPAGAKFFRAAW